MTELTLGAGRRLSKRKTQLAVRDIIKDHERLKRRLCRHVELQHGKSGQLPGTPARATLLSFTAGTAHSEGRVHDGKDPRQRATAHDQISHRESGQRRLGESGDESG